MSPHDAFLMALPIAAAPLVAAAFFLLSLLVPRGLKSVMMNLGIGCGLAVTMLWTLKALPPVWPPRAPGSLIYLAPVLTLLIGIPCRGWVVAIVRCVWVAATIGLLLFFRWKQPEIWGVVAAGFAIAATNICKPIKQGGHRQKLGMIFVWALGASAVLGMSQSFQFGIFAAAVGMTLVVLLIVSARFLEPLSIYACSAVVALISALLACGYCYANLSLLELSLLLVAIWLLVLIDRTAVTARSGWVIVWLAVLLPVGAAIGLAIPGFIKEIHSVDAPSEDESAL